MIWLQQNSKYDGLAEYEHTSGMFKLSSRKTLGNNVPLKTDGVFSILSTVFVALYCFNQQLFLRIGDDCIPIISDLVITVTGDVNNRKLCVEKAGVVVAQIDYTLDMSDQFSNDPTAFVEDEDFDFGLFVSNVSKRSERQRVILGLD
jgi:hypothetical protein